MSDVTAAGTASRRFRWPQLVGLPGGIWLGHVLTDALIQAGRTYLLPLLAMLLFDFMRSDDDDGPLTILSHSTVVFAGLTVLIGFFVALLT